MAAHTKTRTAPAKAKRKPTSPVPSKGSPVKKAASKTAPAKNKKPPVTKVAVKAVKPVSKKAPAAKPAAKAPSRIPAKKSPFVKPASKPASKPAVKAVAKSASKPSAKPVGKPAAKAAVKPVSKAAPKPAVKAVAKSASKPAPAKNPAPAAPAPVKQPSKPVVMARPNPVMTQAALEAERRKLAKIKESQKKPQPVVAPKIKAKTARKYQPEFMKSVLDQPTHSEQTGPMIRYSDADLQEFRELITKKLEDSKRELAYWQGIITHKGEMSGDESESRYGGMEEGVSSEREYASHMASRRLDFIEKLEKALMRIQNKTYGICRVTGKLIDKARLQAVPHATLSMDAKMAISKNPGGSQNP